MLLSTRLVLLVMLLLTLAATVQSFLPLQLRQHHNTATIRTRHFLYIDNDTTTVAAGAGAGGLAAGPGSRVRVAAPRQPIPPPTSNNNNNNKKTKTPPNVRTVDTLEEYNNVLRDARDRIVVVRFQSPYCKACRAIRVAYDKLVKRNAQNDVQFVDVSITTSTTNDDNNNNDSLGETLGIVAVPWGRIYVPNAGLVEELPMPPRHMANFRKTLHSYVQGTCDLPEDFFAVSSSSSLSS